MVFWQEDFRMYIIQVDQLFFSFHINRMHSQKYTFTLHVYTPRMHQEYENVWLCNCTKRLTAGVNFGEKDTDGKYSCVLYCWSWCRSWFEWIKRISMVYWNQGKKNVLSFGHFQLRYFCSSGSITTQIKFVDAPHTTIKKTHSSSINDSSWKRKWQASVSYLQAFPIYIYMLSSIHNVIGSRFESNCVSLGWKFCNIQNKFTYL